MDKTALGNRMKNYEAVTKTKLVRRTPTVIRLDGKAFHTWTKQLRGYDISLQDGPYSYLMHEAMAKTAHYLVEHIQNARLAYVQSDEISILMNDWGKLTTDAWFDNTVQKIVSVAASMATAKFNLLATDQGNFSPTMAFFDARVWNLPVDEVANYFVWRQQDATRNSINMLGQFHFSHKDLQGKNVSEVQEMLFSQYGVNWNNIPTWQKRGYCATRQGIDDEIPIFTQDRNYIERHLEVDDE